MKLDIPCPQCGNKGFKFDAEPTSLDDLQSPTCNGCGYVVTKNDVEMHALKVAEAKAAKMLRATFGKLLK